MVWRTLSAAGLVVGVLLVAWRPWRRRVGQLYYAPLGPPPIEAHLVIPSAAFDLLLEDLDAPAEPSKLRDLM